MKEEWRDVIEYEGLYQVSNYGRIRTVSRFVNSKQKSLRFISQKIRKIELDKDGYHRLQLHKDGQSKKFFVHRLVGYAFLGLSKDKQINHINSIRHDNRLKNLEVCTARENTIHGIKYGYINSQKGELNMKVKLSEQDILTIKTLLQKKVLTQTEIGNLYSVCNQSISNIKLKKNWKHIK